jgi:hypothetical protein
MGENIAAVCFTLACAGFILANRALWFEQVPEAACRALYGGNPFPEAVPIAKYLQEHTTPNETIEIMGSEPEIYFLAHRHSASGYIYMYDLMQPHQYALYMQKDTIQEIETAKPAFLVMVYVNSSWTSSEVSNPTLKDWLGDYSRKYYDLAGMTWIMPDRTEYIWGPDAFKRKFDTTLYVAIMKRKPGI